jgi:hypothetical protein
MPKKKKSMNGDQLLQEAIDAWIVIANLYP